MNKTQRAPLTTKAWNDVMDALRPLTPREREVLLEGIVEALRPETEAYRARAVRLFPVLAKGR